MPTHYLVLTTQALPTLHSSGNPTKTLTKNKARCYVRNYLNNSFFSKPVSLLVAYSTQGPGSSRAMFFFPPKLAQSKMLYLKHVLRRKEGRKRNPPCCVQVKTVHIKDINHYLRHTYITESIWILNKITSFFGFVLVSSFHSRTSAKTRLSCVAVHFQNYLTKKITYSLQMQVICIFLLTLALHVSIVLFKLQVYTGSGYF